MRRRLWWGVVGLSLMLGACAGPGQPPTTADAIFPLPYLIKRQRAVSPYVETRPPVPDVSSTEQR
jgi:hypothetical protein